MKSFTWWDSRRHRIRWTVYVGRAGEGKYGHRLRIDRLNLRTGKARRRVVVR